MLSAGACPVVGVPAGLRARNLAIDSAALEEHFLHLTGNPARGHLLFEPVIDVQTGSGVALVTLVRLLHCEMTRQQASPLLAAHCAARTTRTQRDSSARALSKNGWQI